MKRINRVSRKIKEKKVPTLEKQVPMTEETILQ